MSRQQKLNEIRAALDEIRAELQGPLHPGVILCRPVRAPVTLNEPEDAQNRAPGIYDDGQTVVFETDEQKDKLLARVLEEYAFDESMPATVLTVDPTR